MRRWLYRHSWKQPIWNIFWRLSSPPIRPLLPHSTFSKSPKLTPFHAIQISFFSSNVNSTQPLPFKRCSPRQLKEILSLESPAPAETSELRVEQSRESSSPHEPLQIRWANPASPALFNKRYGDNLSLRVWENLKVIFIIFRIKYSYNQYRNRALNYYWAYSD
jgi:hypothetical protein